MAKRKGYFSWLLNKLKANILKIVCKNKRSTILIIFCIIIAVVFSLCLIQNNIGDFYNQDVNIKIENELNGYLAGDKSAFALDATVEVSDKNIKISPFYYFDKTLFPQHLTYTFDDESYEWDININNIRILCILSIVIACLFAYAIFKFVNRFMEDRKYGFKINIFDTIKFICIVIIGFILLPIQPQNVSEEYKKNVETDVQNYIADKNENFENNYYISTDSVGTIVVSGICENKNSNSDEESSIIKVLFDTVSDAIKRITNYVPKIYVYNNDLNVGIWKNNTRINFLIIAMLIILIIYLLLIFLALVWVFIFIGLICKIIFTIQDSIKKYRNEVK